MDEIQREICEKLRSMESSQAAQWLIENHREDGCVYLSKRTWKKEDQILLAEHFLKSVPHASAICYEALLTIMALSRFVGVLKKYIPQNRSDKELLKYYIYPALEKHAKTENDRHSINQIRSAIQ